jgi:hypothetical protein
MELQFVLVLAAVVVVVVIVWSWRRRVRRAQLAATPVLIGAAMAKRGISPADAEAAGREAELVQAVQLCAQCIDQEGCRSWLMSGDGRRSPPYCPNAALMDGIAHAKAAAAPGAPAAAAWTQASEVATPRPGPDGPNR